MTTYAAFVDPGITGSGVAWEKPPDGVDFACLNPHSTWKGLCWDQRAARMADIVLDTIPSEVGSVYVEMPCYRSSGKGDAAARSGSLVKLSHFVGLLHGLIISEGMNFIPLEILEWKGQLSKDKVDARVRRALGGAVVKAKSHAVDALGMLLHKRGEL